MTGLHCRAMVEAMKSIELSTQDLGRRAGQASDQVVHETAPWIEGLGRCGHFATGLIIYGAFMMVKARYGRLVVR